MQNLKSNNNDFLKVKKIVDDLNADGILTRGRGYCIAMSDIIQKLLLHHGIESYLQECSLMVIKTPSNDISLIGYPLDVDHGKEQLNTHVICITRTDIPILIDLSIGHLLPGVPFVCEPIKDKFPFKETQFNFLHGKFFYTIKTQNCELPFLHERSIIERIHTDRKIFANINKIIKVMLVISVLTSVNFIRGGYDFYQKYINKTNGFGPVHKTLIK